MLRLILGSENVAMTKFRLRKNSFISGYFLILIVVILSAQLVNGQLITKRASSISLYPYSPKSIDSLNDLPVAVKTRLVVHLKDRLGEEFFSKLKFTYGVVVNFDDLYRIDPGAREYKWQIFTYKLEFAFSMLELGIKKFEAEIWLDGEGNIIREIDLPNIRNHPEKAKIISVKEAKKISKQNKFSYQKIELAYRVKEDSIAWRIVRYERDTTWWLDIGAHNGEILEKVGMVGIQ